MKKPLLLIVFLLQLSVCCLNAQYIPVFESDVVWREYEWVGNSLDGGISEYRQTFPQGDTTINGIKYVKLYKTGYWEDNRIHFPHTINGFTNQPVGFFRNDSSSRKVFFVPIENSDSIEYLLYDFNLSVGDTLNENWYGVGGSDITVSSIDTVEIFGHWLKRYNLSYGPTSSWPMAIIEGIGSVSGIASILITGTMGVEAKLECISLNDTAYNITLLNTVEIDYAGSSCWLYSNITSFEQTPGFTLTPNPATSAFQIAVTAESVKSIFTLTDLTGKVLRSATLETENSSISIAELPGGVYLATITTTDGRKATQKLIKE